MRRAASLDDYLATTDDAFVVERAFTTCRVGDLFAVVVWGRPTEDDARLIVRSRAPELAAAPHALLLDYRDVMVIDPDAFRSLAAFVSVNAEILARVTTKVALVKPRDPFAGATVAGFYSVVPAPYPSQLCATLEEAEAWLGRPLAATVATVRGEAAAGRPVTSALARVLDGDPTLEVERAAEAIGLSARTMQRKLAAEATTFLAQARQAKVRRAKQLLANTDDKVAAIAQAVGCASVQHFTDLFREETGVPPGTWRTTARS